MTPMLSRRAARTPTADTLFSIVIPTKNRAEAVQGLVRTLAEQTERHAEIVIVDQSACFSCDRVLDPACTSTGNERRLVYLHAPWIDGAAAARNAGFAVSTAPYVVFLDDDAIPEPGCLELLVETLDRHPQLLAAGGLVSNYSPPPLPARVFRRVFYLRPLYDERQPIYWQARSYPRGALIRCGKLNGGCMAFRREALEACGGFDSRYRGSSIAEDIEISARLLKLAGRRDAIALVGGALIYHASEGSWKRNPRSIEFEIVATQYWFRRNYPWNLANRLRFAWMCAGLLLWSLASSLKRLDAGPLRSFLAGVRSIRNGYRGCPFLKADLGRAGQVS